MRNIVCLSLTVVLCDLGAACYQQREPQTKFRDPGTITRVEFYIGGAIRPAPKYQVKSFRGSNRDSVELGGRFHGLALGEDITIGEYDYVLEPVDTARWPLPQYRLSGKVALYSSDCWVTLQMPDDPVGGDYGEIFVTGRIRPFPKGQGTEPIWVRLQNVVQASQFSQARANPDGSFRISAGRITGNFVLTVCHGDDVLYVSVVHFINTHPGYLEITLPQQAQH